MYKWPVDFHYIGEEIEYNCSICGWTEATIIDVQADKIMLRHEGEKIGIYEDDRGKIEDKEYYGN